MSDLLEHRTDAFDTIYIVCEKFPYHDTPSQSGRIVIFF